MGHPQEGLISKWGGGRGSHLKEHKPPPHHEEDFNSKEEEAAPRVDGGRTVELRWVPVSSLPIPLLAVIAFYVQ